nr:MAG TPA: hypothetical protein [Caudoviricetes sp.]
MGGDYLRLLFEVVLVAAVSFILENQQTSTASKNHHLNFSIRESVVKNL